MTQVEMSTPLTQLLVKNVQAQISHIGIILGMTAAVLGINHSLAAPAALADTITTPTIERSISGLDDGTYLFGQSSERDQAGNAYVVMEITDQQAVGAFYMPSSSFDCFYGEVAPDQLALTVVDSYDQTHHPYNVALEVSEPLVAGTGAGTLGLAGFYQLNALTEQDQTILNTCQVQYGEFI